jgi:hypothetical protein
MSPRERSAASDVDEEVHHIADRDVLGVLPAGG